MVSYLPAAIFNIGPMFSVLSEEREEKKREKQLLLDLDL